MLSSMIVAMLLGQTPQTLSKSMPVTAAPQCVVTAAPIITAPQCAVVTAPRVFKFKQKARLFGSRKLFRGGCK